MKEFDFATMADSREIYRYVDTVGDENEGIYVNDGEQFIESQLEMGASGVTVHKVKEVVEKIRRRTFTKRDNFDSDPDMLNVEDCWIKLNTGEVFSHNADRLSISKLPIRYEQKAKCFEIKKFLKSTLDDEDIVKVVRMIGYLLEPSCKHQKAFMLVGNGSNGKSVIIDLLAAFVGKSNTSNVSLQGLSERFGTSDLYGKWLNTHADIPNKKIAETSNFKLLAAGETIRAEKKGKDSYTFRNRAKMVFSANDIPPSDDESDGYFRRWVIVNFRRTFEGADADTGLIKKLTTPEELSGLLNVALAARKALENEHGFPKESIEQIKAAYETGASRVREFLEQKCEIDVGDKALSIEASHLQHAYREYGRSKGERILDDNILGKELKRLGVENRLKAIGGRRRHCYIGIRLKVEPPTTLTQFGETAA
ncbi:DNA primase family protein [Nitrososphaera sp.]|uniref:DNA primase family protein n=1 Tax=Nitrososphaera sp. TaxID=1971748 RepID=UPI003D6FF2FB